MVFVRFISTIFSTITAPLWSDFITLSIFFDIFFDEYKILCPKSLPKFNLHLGNEHARVYAFFCAYPYDGFVMNGQILQMKDLY